MAEAILNSINIGIKALDVYPIGSIYMSVNSTSPSVLFGGTWEQLTDRFLLAAGSTYSAGTTGGAAAHTPSGTLSGGAVQSHTLTLSEIPSHTHNYVLGHEIGRFETSDSGEKTRANNLNTNLDTGSAGGGQGHSHGFTQPTFTGTSQNTMPPYLTVYMWKRTA